MNSPFNEQGTSGVPSIDLNGDVGEGAATDREFIPLLTSVNIACGGHAGDERTMIEAMESALAASVQIGAHPGFADRANFGRREMNVTAGDVFDIVTEQLGRFDGLASVHGAVMAHVKPHGALYHQAARDPALAESVVRAILTFDHPIALVGPWRTALEQAASEAKLRFVREAFADRAYTADGRLVPRLDPRAIINDEDQAAQQVLAIVCEGLVTSIDGTRLPIPAETICLHGDSPNALRFATRLRADLQVAGIRLRPFGLSAEDS